MNRREFLKSGVALAVAPSALIAPGWTPIEDPTTFTIDLAAPARDMTIIIEYTAGEIRRAFRIPEEYFPRDGS